MARHRLPLEEGEVIVDCEDERFQGSDQGETGSQQAIDKVAVGS